MVFAHDITNGVLLITNIVKTKYRKWCMHEPFKITRSLTVLSSKKISRAVLILCQKGSLGVETSNDPKSLNTYVSICT